MSVVQRATIRTKHHRVFFDKNWKNRPRPYWFNVKYNDGMRRVCVPFLTIDLNCR